MTYLFQGIFTPQSCAALVPDDRKYTVRDLRPRYPFFGIRIHPREDDRGEDTVDLEEETLRIIDAGLTSGLVLRYATFGGPIEYLCGFELCESSILATSRFEAHFTSRENDLSVLFIAKMTAYGLPPGQTVSSFPSRGVSGANSPPAT